MRCSGDSIIPFELDCTGQDHPENFDADSDIGSTFPFLVLLLILFSLLFQRPHSNAFVGLLPHLCQLVIH